MRARSTAEGAGQGRSGAPQAHRFGPWLWGARVDLAAFGGSALVALAVAIGLQWTAVGSQADVGVPEWVWLVCVLGVDVAHVYSTLFRTYLDTQELRRHPLRYGLLPVVLLALLFLLRQEGTVVFWRVLAYLAVFHFVRQQVGWAAVYRSRARQGRLDRWIDEFALYSVTLYPVVWWHAHLADRNFAWFRADDFLALAPEAHSAVTVLGSLAIVSVALFLTRQGYLLLTQRTFFAGKCLVVLSTALLWNVGIVWTNTDLGFTLTNVLAHGVPYMVLLWFYAKARAKEAPRMVLSGVVRRGGGAFVLLLVSLALLEEFFWDRAVNFERAWLFGQIFEFAPSGADAQAFVIAFLALPQVLHYALDGVLWRRSDAKARPAQRAAIGA